MKKTKEISIDLSTEEKIKQAAKELFTQKGFEATKTREIAEKAGINLALMNYYFRSKQKLYDIIMEENSLTFKAGIAALFGNQDIDVYKKIEKLATLYIDAFILNRDLAAFLVAIINNKEKSSFLDGGHDESFVKSRKIFFAQIASLIREKKLKPVHPMHIISNVMGLVIFPFAARPMLQKRASLTDKEFTELMLERKKLIPIWVKAMLEYK